MSEAEMKKEAAEKPAEEFVEVTLSKPINSFGEQVSVLKLRKPTGADLIRIGNPVIFDPITDPPRITHDMPRMVQMLMRLSGVPTSSFDQLDPRDLVSCAWAVTNFFLPTPGI
jgi:Phage tail assembly chaperone proteins, E, or 41 or 14